MAYSTIPKGSLYMDTKLYTGNNSPSNTISGIPFAPNLIWIKARGAATDHVLFDTVRGVYKSLSTNDTTGENNNTNQLQTFTSDGWTMGDLDTSNAATTFASWNWKAGTAVSGSTTGSGTAKTYTGSVNTTSGFSIINYTGNGSSGHTIPHNLNAVPKMFIVKSPSIADDGWFVYNGVQGATKNFRMEATGAVGTSTVYWNDTEPTSSVFTLGSSGGTNQNGQTYIAYIFADVKGFSKMGSYTGNGNADGTFVYTGFKPSFVLIKNSSATADWCLRDDKRSPINVTQDTLFPNTADSESTGGTSYDIDFLSNGFKIRNTSSRFNTSGNTYIYMAFAENPFVATSGTNAIPVTAR